MERLTPEEYQNASLLTDADYRELEDIVKEYMEDQKDLILFWIRYGIDILFSYLPTSMMANIVARLYGKTLKRDPELAERFLNELRIPMQELCPEQVPDSLIAFQDKILKSIHRLK